jgi:hypothetical protein
VFQTVTQTYAVAFEEHKAMLWIFHRWNARAVPAFQLRNEYTGLTCPKCHVYDPFEAAELGLSTEIKIPQPLRSRDIFTTRDSRVVVSKKCRNVLEGIEGMNVRFFPLPKDPTFFVVFPCEKLSVSKKVVVDGNSSTDVLRAEGPRCTKCKRFSVMMISLELVKPLPVVFGAVILDGWPIQGNREAWFASDAVRLAVKAAKLKGWIFQSLPSLERA